MPEIEPSHIIVIVAVVIAAIRGWMEKRQAARQEDELLEDINERVAERQQQRQQEAARQAAPPPVARPATGGGFEDLYEEFRREIVQRQQAPTVPPPLKTVPPPPKVEPSRPRPEPTVPRLTAAEEAALQRLKQTQWTVPEQSAGNRRRRSLMFRHRGDLRRAFVMKELLDPPVALRELPRTGPGALH